MKKLQKIYLLLLVASPLVALAQNVSAISSRIDAVKQILNIVIGLLFVIATLVFLWGVVQFISSAGDEKKRTEGKSKMTWGIIGLAIMAAAWSMAGILVNFFGATGNTPPVTPPPSNT